ncbi:DUF4097 family beta strand repeat-containing protein [Niallia sp. FSL R7-0271]|uniref:DUF4097 family beta strand repeat-containing protein n=1 Tax=Niallia sp. FSL R7-0271 TaxID=2921678 RepID=UPI0030FAB842
MKQPVRRITIIASGLIVLGILLAAIGFFSGAKLSIIKTETGLKAVGPEDRKHEEWVLNEFKNLEVDLADADIEIIPSNEYKLEIHRMEGSEITHQIKNNTLIINDKTAFPAITFSMNFSGAIQQTKIKVYIPESTEFDDVYIVSKFGDTNINGVTTNNFKIASNDSDVVIKNVKSNKLAIENKFGDITASNVEAAQLAIQINDGDAELSKIDITENASVINQFGDTNLSDFTSHDIKLESKDGDINIKGKLLGQSIIDSKFGDINLALANKESELSYDIDNDFGDITINGTEIVSKASKSVNGEDTLTVQSNDGDVEITLE